MSKKDATPTSSTPTPAIAMVQDAGVAHRVHEYVLDDQLDQGTSLGAAAAKVLGVDPGQMYKTLVAFVEGRPCCALVPVNAHLKLKTLAAAAGGKKASMATGAEATRLTGYVVGGISPFGQRRQLPVFVDSSVLDWSTLYLPAGKRGLTLEVAPQVLEGLLHATVVSGLADT
ncbi:aminoacyl-tRNA deacylase [Actinomyces minihominis]|uniref:aminoacyl-tRNA deacylase n=1 Tax=Actinomyces minihominis TaxID=2002838 RepID=UPI000C0789C0|nr:aminoacyl-tRNA deacylase [Actinomyces minihominis]